MSDQPSLASAQVIQERGQTVVRVDGELDMSTVPMLEGVLRAVGASRPQWVALDLREVDFMDSAGLKAILTARERFAASGRTLQLRNEPPCVRRLFALAGATL